MQNTHSLTITLTLTCNQKHQQHQRRHSGDHDVKFVESTIITLTTTTTTITINSCGIGEIKLHTQTHLKSQKPLEGSALFARTLSPIYTQACYEHKCIIFMYDCMMLYIKLRRCCGKGVFYSEFNLESAAFLPHFIHTSLMEKMNSKFVHCSSICCERLTN